MKKRFFLLTILVFVLILSLFACSSKSSNDNYNPGLESAEDNLSIIVSDTDRKIIYTVSLDLKTDNLKATINHILNLVKDNDGWNDNLSEQEDYAYLEIRIKTSKLDWFINNLNTNYDTSKLKISAKDITEQYVNTSLKQTSLEKELERLQALYEKASFNELMTINQRISEVETRIQALDRELLVFDSLVDYSTVYIYLYGPKAKINKTPYKKTLSNSFISGWNAAVTLLKFLLQVIVTLIPFLIIIIPVTGGAIGIRYLYKKRKKK